MEKRAEGEGSSDSESSAHAPRVLSERGIGSVGAMVGMMLICCLCDCAMQRRIREARFYPG